MESLWVYEKFSEFLVIKPKTSQNHAQEVFLLLPQRLLEGLAVHY